MLLWSALCWGFLTRRDYINWLCWSLASGWLWPVGSTSRRQAGGWRVKSGVFIFLVPSLQACNRWLDPQFQSQIFVSGTLPFHFQTAINSSFYALQSPLSFLNTLHMPLWIILLLNLTQIIQILFYFLFPTERPWLEYFLSRNFVSFYYLISQDTILWPFSYLAHTASLL